MGELVGKIRGAGEGKRPERAFERFGERRRELVLTW
jgi:hypothetical protein